MPATHTDKLDMLAYLVKSTSFRKYLSLLPSSCLVDRRVSFPPQRCCRRCRHRLAHVTRPFGSISKLDVDHAPPMRRVFFSRWGASPSRTGMPWTRPAGWPTMLPTSTWRSGDRKGRRGDRKTRPLPAASCCTTSRASGTSGSSFFVTWCNCN